MYQVTPLMGPEPVIVVFAVVVIGGMGSIMGSILTGLGLGVIEGLTKVFCPQASSTVVFSSWPLFCSSALPACSAKKISRGVIQIMNVKNLPPSVYGLLLLGLIAAPFLGAWFCHEAAVLCAVCHGLQPAAGYTGSAVLRPCGLSGRRGLWSGHAVKVWGPRPKWAVLIGTLSGPAGPGDWLVHHPPPGHPISP